MPRGIPNVKSSRQVVLDAYLECIRDADSLYVEICKLQKRYADLHIESGKLLQKLADDQFFT